MDLSIGIFVIGILLSIIGWLVQKILNGIMREIKELRRDFEKVQDAYVKTKTAINSLPCKVEPRLSYNCGIAKQSTRG